MRMWNVDTRILCRKHLLGEHLEHHMFIGTVKAKKNLNGYVKNNLVEPKKFQERHNEIVQEMLSRGYNHNSELEEVDISYLPLEVQNATVDSESALEDLLSRCEECKKRYEEINNES